MRDIDDTPQPSGNLAMQVVAMPADTNADGDIYGGWLMSQMDLAGSTTATRRAGGRVATVAVQGMAFLTPVNVGAVVSFYTDIQEVGRSSIRISVEVWTLDFEDDEPVKVTEGEFVYVAIDDHGRTRSVD
ncbi:acyl-CoA thioesterase [Spongiibacter sp. KMU-158]|uniref:Acyl-CoA thioesterase n=1 Tax=Spongiibacter pelagi TaxID=2760804 RepID=A0A927C0P9_9GAMM|nr:acyl-CoA thioesterase [Spongiibacter pelagi]MBD2857646.1 acyl-CoA thioesterase [Spongiibacter pelagi]